MTTETLHGMLERLTATKWEVVPGHEADDWGIRNAGESHGSSVAQMLWEEDAKQIVALHNNAQPIADQLQAVVERMESSSKGPMDVWTTGDVVAITINEVQDWIAQLQRILGTKV